jgi:hypothetical protein
VHLTLPTDSTHVASPWLGTQEHPEIMGANIGHHDASHHGQDPAKLDQLALIEEAELTVFGEFLDKLRQTTESDHSLLDRTSVLYASNLGNSSSHNNNLPILLAGSRFKHQGLMPTTRRTTPTTRTSSSAGCITWAAKPNRLEPATASSARCRLISIKRPPLSLLQ